MNSDKVYIYSLDSSKTPTAIGPYSKATKVDMGDKFMIFTSGQIGVDPTTGNLVSDDIEAQTKQALDNVKNILEENGSSLDQVAKTTIYLDSMDDFKAMNTVYATYFTENCPARATVSVKGLPKSAKVEIDAIAFSFKS